MRLSMALSAAVAALVLGGAALLGPVPAALAAAVVILVIAWGWPRQMGAPARLSLSVTLAVAGGAAVLLMLLWPPLEDGHSGAWTLFEPLAVVVAWSTMASFVVQLVRGTGRPLRLESTVATMGGAFMAVVTACWVAVSRWTDTPAVAGLVITLAVTVAAVSLEPVQNSGGCFPPPPGYFERVREICDEYDVLLVSDEVICAFGRIGSMFACEDFGYVPDMITCAKGLTNGVIPMGAVLTSAAIHDAFMSGPDHVIELFHGYTYSGHPLACAAALATLDTYAEENLFDKALELGEKHGYRNAQATVIAPTGTIGFMMDCDTTGIEPDFSLLKFKKLVGGGSMQIVNQAVGQALRTLGAAFAANAA